MSTATYARRKGELETYFDRTAVDAWAKLTSTAPVGSVRATVRAGRDRMRATLLSCLPPDLSGRRLLDAGCGTGALAVEAAKRGAEVVAIDISPTLVGLAQERLPSSIGEGRIEFRVGDMLDPSLGEFDHVIAMDSLIHYQLSDVTKTLALLAARTRDSLVFTLAPRTPALSAMYFAGKLFPRSDRSPAIVPVPDKAVQQAFAEEPRLAGFSHAIVERVATGFYISQANSLTRK